MIHISILDFELFPEVPEFYATYMLLNVKNHYLYSDKLRLSVLELNKVDIATDEDKQYQIDYWARLFKATEWKELKAMAEKNEYVNVAVETIYKVTSDATIREQCRAREDYYRLQRTNERERERIAKELEESRKIIDEQKEEIERLRRLLEEQNKKV